MEKFYDGNFRLVLTSFGLLSLFGMVVATWWDGLFGRNNEDLWEHIIGWLITFGLLFLSYRYCPFSIIVDNNLL